MDFIIFLLQGTLVNNFRTSVILRTHIAAYRQNASSFSLPGDNTGHPV